jgi:hypothetical protein
MWKMDRALPGKHTV